MRIVRWDTGDDVAAKAMYEVNQAAMRAAGPPGPKRCVAARLPAKPDNVEDATAPGKEDLPR